jgi:hypothetical protein
LPSVSGSGASCCPSALLPAHVCAATSSPVGPGGLSKPAARYGPRSAPAVVPSLPWPARRPAIPLSSAGGIRTHGLELMRLARTASPLPRSLAGRNRTCGLRRPKPAGWPTPPQPVVCSAPPAGLEPAASGLRARRHRPFDHGGIQLRRQGSNLPLASNSRASCRLDHAGSGGRRGSRTPKAHEAHPFSRRGTAPVAVLPKWPRQASNLQPSA